VVISFNMRYAFWSNHIVVDNINKSDQLWIVVLDIRHSLMLNYIIQSDLLQCLTVSRGLVSCCIINWQTTDVGRDLIAYPTAYLLPGSSSSSSSSAV